MTRWMPIWIMAGALFASGCNKDQDTTTPSAPVDVATTSSAAAASVATSAPNAESDDLGVISNPAHESMKQTAPAEFDVLFHTSAGDFAVHVTRDWAPVGADRFYSLVTNKFYDGNRFFRVAPGQSGGRFVVQWGIHGEPSVNTAWQSHPQAKIDDDPVRQSNAPGSITFATSGPNSRTTQLFINYADNSFLDGMGFSTFGEVSGDGMQTVVAINSEYGERPDQGRVQFEGNAYLNQKFPNLDYIITATVVK
ncbi:MAG: peptidyl-prolyl cis-trans isomerase A (cyclophilin A) [Gammaproteobacteria bacterium]|jgi:peptidyl-prolyl cis-trans isomerase A (cyclophilin A)